MLSKDHILILISTALFLITVLYAGYVYATWNSPIEPEEYQVEVNLPVIDWVKYFGLSKQPESASM